MSGLTSVHAQLVHVPGTGLLLALDTFLLDFLLDTVANEGIIDIQGWYKLDEAEKGREEEGPGEELRSELPVSATRTPKPGIRGISRHRQNLLTSYRAEAETGEYVCKR